MICPLCNEVHEATQTTCPNTGAPIPVTVEGSGSKVEKPQRRDPFAAVKARVEVGAVGSFEVEAPATAEIGRAADLPFASLLPDNISGRHLTMRLQADGQLFITDEHSTNGVYVNGARLSPGEDTVVRPEDTVALGADPPLDLRIEVSY